MNLHIPVFSVQHTQELEEIISVVTRHLAGRYLSGVDRKRSHQHGLVSSGTTSRQTDKEPDARFVGYLGAVGEGALAIITILAIATFFSESAALVLLPEGPKSLGSGGISALASVRDL